MLDGGRRREGIVLAMLIALFPLAGCTPSGGESSPVAAPSSPAATPTPTVPPPALTVEEAEKALERHLATDDALRAGGALRMALELVRDGQSALTAAAYRSKDLSPTRYRWETTRLLVPRWQQAPYWFTAIMERRALRGGEPRTVLLTLMKDSEEGRWRLSFASVLAEDSELPEFAVDEDGYAVSLPTRDESVAVSPQLMAPLHASVAEEGEKGFSAELIAPGPFTTGYSDEIAERKRRAKHDGLNYDSIFSATQSPIFALRTEDGGALVLYELSRTTSLSAKLPSAPWIDVPREARWATDERALAGELRITETHQYASVVPPRESDEPARVIAYDGAGTRVSGK